MSSPLMPRVMRNYATGSLSFRAPRAVIPSAARNLIKSSWGCRTRFFTPLRSVQNDMAGGSVQNDMAGGSVQNDMTEGGLPGNRIHSNVDMTTQPDFCIMRMPEGEYKGV